MISTRIKGIKVIGERPREVLTAVEELKKQDKNMVTCVYCYVFKGVKNCKNG